MRGNLRIAAVIPALDEEHVVGRVVAAIPGWVDRVVVADNGSRDATAEVARRAGASTVFAAERGYGSACWAGIAALSASAPPDVVVFLDADGSDAPEEMARLVDPLVARRADLVVGARRRRERMLFHQQLGTRLVCALLRIGFGARVTDIGPFRAIRWDALQAVEMRDRRYGWTAEMQARALRAGLRVVEVPVSWRRGLGRSKISGTLSGTLRAGHDLVRSVLREAVGWRRDRLLRRAGRWRAARRLAPSGLRGVSRDERSVTFRPSERTPTHSGAS